MVGAGAQLVDDPARSGARTLLRIGIVLGIGTAGTLDQVILHETLQWHHFYVHTTLDWRLFIDGLFHLASAGFLLTGALLLWSRRRLLSAQPHGRALWAGLLIGLGGFNLYDGIVQHKILRLHQVREGVDNLLPYDLAFNGIALAFLIAGCWLWTRVRGTP